MEELDLEPEPLVLRPTLFLVHHTASLGHSWPRALGSEWSGEATGKPDKLKNMEGTARKSEEMLNT